MNAPRIATALAAASLGTLMVALTLPVAAEDDSPVSANIGVVSNYMWRGVTQTQDGPAVQGGLDYAHPSGFYIGTWASNVDWNDEGAPQISTVIMDPDGNAVLDANGYPIYQTSGSSNSSSPTYELDGYLGFGNNITDDLKYNLSAIYYAYPDGRDSDFAEIGGSMTWKWITGGLAYTVYGENDGGLFDDGDMYYYGALDFGLPYEFALNFHGGYYDFRNSNGDSYGNWGTTVSRAVGDYGTVSLTLDQNLGNDDVYDTDPKVWVGWKKTF